MKAIKFPQVTTEYAKDQEQYNTLPVFKSEDETKRVVMCFQLSNEEVENVVKNKRLWVHMLTFGHPLQPLSVFALKDYFKEVVVNGLNYHLLEESQENNNDKALSDAIELWGIRAQLEMLQEEATELALAARKFIREDSEKRYDNLAEEIADVEILINQTDKMFPNMRSRIEKYKQQKLDRLRKRIDDKNFELTSKDPSHGEEE